MPGHARSKFKPTLCGSPTKPIRGDDFAVLICLTRPQFSTMPGLIPISVVWLLSSRLTPSAPTYLPPKYHCLISTVMLYRIWVVAVPKALQGLTLIEPAAN